MRRHEYESPYNPATTELSRALKYDRDIRPDTLDKITRVLEGVKHTDEMISQKDTELQSKNNLLFQKEQLLVQKDKNINKLQGSIFDKEQKEFIEVLSQRYPNDYSTNFNEWPNDIWGKDVINRKDYGAIEKHLPTFKADVLKNKFIEVLQQRFPHDYSARFEDWPNIWGKQVINRGDVEVMQKWIPIYEKEIKENLKKSVLSEKTAKENELKKLTDKEQETLELKEQLRLKELETQNKDQLLFAKELEKQELVRQKEEEVHNKSLAKNQVIGELQEDIGLKEKEALNLRIESLMKQLEFKDKEMELKTKESQLKDKALEDAYEIAKQKQIVNELKEKELADVLEIVKQKDIINELKEKEVQDESHINRLKAKQLDNLIVIQELKGKLSDLQALYEQDISFSDQFTVIQFRAENSIANNDIADIQYLIGHIGGLVEDGRENTELALNESPVLQLQENHVQNPLANINNFDINNINALSINVSIPIPQVHENNPHENHAQQHVPVINHGNFDINQMHITHSVLLGGEGSESFEIIKDESLN